MSCVVFETLARTRSISTFHTWLPYDHIVLLRDRTAYLWNSEGSLIGFIVNFLSLIATLLKSILRGFRALCFASNIIYTWHMHGERIFRRTSRVGVVPALLHFNFTNCCSKCVVLGYVVAIICRAFARLSEKSFVLKFMRSTCGKSTHLQVFRYEVLFPKGRLIKHVFFSYASVRYYVTAHGQCNNCFQCLSKELCTLVTHFFNTKSEDSFFNSYIWPRLHWVCTLISSWFKQKNMNSSVVYDSNFFLIPNMHVESGNIL